LVSKGRLSINRRGLHRIETKFTIWLH